MPYHPAATFGSYHACPKVEPGPHPHVGGPAAEASPNVFIEGQPALRVGDKLICVGAIDKAIEGIPNILVNGEPMAYVGARTADGGIILTGAGTVFANTNGGAPAASPSSGLVPQGGIDSDDAVSTAAPADQHSNSNSSRESATARDASVVKSAKELDTIPDKAIHPSSLEDAENILKNRRKQIAAEGYKPKYTDAELAKLAQHGDIGSERFQVRFMEEHYLNDRNTPDAPLSGKMGMVMKGETGEGAKYWSTSLDQLEDADTDPKLISEKLGLEYDPTKKYTLVLVDTEKSTPLTGVKSVPATFEKVGEFANTELPKQFPKDFTDKAMTPEFQAEYAKHYSAAVESGHLPTPWSRDTKKFEEYLQTTDLPLNERKLLIQRMEMHDKLGNNHDYLGNGLTKDLNLNSPNEFGTVETLNFERKTINLKELHEAGAITVIKDLKPL